MYVEIANYSLLIKEIHAAKFRSKFSSLSSLHSSVARRCHFTNTLIMDVDKRISPILPVVLHNDPTLFETTLIFLRAVVFAKHVITFSYPFQSVFSLLIERQAYSIKLSMYLCACPTDI